MTAKTYLTAAVAEKVNKDNIFNQFVLKSLRQHMAGNWGEVSEADTADNTANPTNALGVYKDADGNKIWVKQDYDIITILFPCEY